MNHMLRRTGKVLALICGLGLSSLTIAAEPADTAPLRSPDSFADIKDKRARSVALFTEAAKVLMHPRCVNCHPVTRTPAQGEDSHTHMPVVFGGSDGHGVAGMPCQNCHKDSNVETATASVQSIPGNSHWHLAPASMAWLGKTAQEICEQLKDQSRNGGRDLEKIKEHMVKDPLVGWAWDPGAGRQPAPGTQAQFGALIAAWADSGASCPSSTPLATR